MVQNINYKDSPEHYKSLIQKINEECDFPSYLMYLGYKLLKKSAGSFEFSKDKDRIVVMSSRSPVSYFNRSDSEDKGRFFSFLKKREDNFYQAVKSGLEIINRSYEFEALKPEKQVSNNKSLEENYNIALLSKPVYLVKERMINLETINSTAFKGRIFNAFHYKDNTSRIANIAFPKFDLEGNVKNYILYNRPYRDRETGEIRKFKLVLNRKDHYLFYSNIPKNGVKRIIFGECGIDVLSFHELVGEEGDFYVSFGGNIYKEKLDFFIELIIPFLSNKAVEIVSALDNDLAGYEFDLKVFSRLNNEFSKSIYFETNFKNGVVQLKVHYNQELRNTIVVDSLKVERILTNNKSMNSDIRKTIFLDKLMYEFSIPKLMEHKHHELGNYNMMDVLMLTLNGLYLPTQTNILKSKTKDWNQDLMDSKKKVCTLK